MLKSENFVIIQGWMCNELELKGNELLVFALIYGFSQDGESKFNGGRKYIAETFNISLPTVDRALYNLCERDYIHKIESDDYTHTDAYFVNLGVVKKLYEGSKETLLGGSKETLLNNISNLKNRIKSKSNSKELLQLGNSKKDVDKKKPNLYSKCMFSIEAYTQDKQLREYLKNMLDLRLEIAKDENKPFYFSMWTHLLKELTDLGGKKDVELAKDIVLNSTSHGWKHFYEIADNQYIKNNKNIPARKRLEQLDDGFDDNTEYKSKFWNEVKNGNATKF